MRTDLYADLFTEEDRHFWHIAKRNTIIELLDRHLNNKKNNMVLDIGCGTGKNMEALSVFGEVNGVDPVVETLKYASSRGLTRQIHARADNLTTETSFFDVVTILDVLERIQEAIDLAQSYNVVVDTRKNGRAKLIKRQSWIRENMGKSFTILSQVILNTWISDFTCSFKLFTKDASKKIFSTSCIHRWVFDSEILFLARKINFSITELPVNLKNDVDSRVQITSVVLTTFIDLLKIRFGKYQYNK